MSSFARNSFALLALSGCMKIYSDPELPDVEITWDLTDCREGAGEVGVVVMEYESREVVAEARTPCTDLRLRIEDLPRDYFWIEGTLYTTTGDPFTVVPAEADLRNGVSEHVYMYFAGFSNFRIAWEFADGASCASLGAPFAEIAIEHTLGFREVIGPSCEAGVHLLMAQPGTLRARVRAMRDPFTPVAASPLTDPIVVESYEDFVDAGTVILTPCSGAACP